VLNLLPTVILSLLSFQSAVPQDLAGLESRAQAGDAKAMVQLGVVYASGNGVAADDTEAVTWFRKAAEKGDASGEYALSEMYMSGRGVAADMTEGVKWLRRAAADGDARGQFNLAAIYAQGQGLPHDDSEAAKWMRKAADQGLADGQFGLGSMYAHGKGVPQDAMQAATWYRKAVDQGDPAAMNNLAFLLATSTDQRIRNPKEAVAVAQKAVGILADSAPCLDTLATAQFEAGHPDLAADAERRALKLNPDSASYQKALDKYLALVKP
jgi:TPR repeat protein